MRGLRLFLPSLLILALLVATVPAGADNEKEWSYTLLAGDDGWVDSYPNSINSSGRIVGFWDAFELTSAGAIDWSTFEQRAVLWKNEDADPTELELLSGMDFSWAAAINESGQICGNQFISVYHWPHAVIWDKWDKPRDVHPDSTETGYPGSQVWSINHKGEGVGELMGGSPIYRAYYWSDEGDGNALPNPSTVESWRVSRALSINKSGEIAGEAFSGPWMPRAVCWSASHSATDLHTDLVAAESDIVTSRAYEMTDDGTVAGIAWNAAWNGSITETWAWTWTAEDGVTFVSRGLTDHGLIWQGTGKYLVGAIGEEILRNASPTEAEAALWTWNEGKDLWELDILPGLSGYGAMAAFDANKSGSLVGVAYDEDGYMHAWAAMKKDKKKKKK